ncbi:acyl-CoA dehydrogenase family protein [Dactylosporangium sp. NBC_01737]|uniref:acyl-CoA dehydrogenase family protein n=1 Tax=Dactylosporangium sp. NBC_01737 TaxID=2975959 RepID=UPI002E129D3B|nr:acyl-CoA dehydrogenase family protein [Dactylosporangium sp. NBC_01737]
MPATSFADPAVDEFRREVTAWLTTAIPAEWRERRDHLTMDEEIEIRRAWDRQLFDAGYAGLSWPERFGGRGLGVVEDFTFNDIAARMDAPEGLGRVGRLLAGPAIIHHGTPEMCARFLPAILKGEENWCQGFSEPGAGSDLASLHTRAVRDGDVYRIQGQKVWTTYAQFSDWCLLLARTGAAGSRSRGLSLMLVPMRQPGVEVRPLINITGTHEFNEVFFDGAETSTDLLVGAEDEGWVVSGTILTHERGVGFGAIALNQLHGYLRLFTEHCAAHAPAIAARLPEFVTRVELLRWQMMRSLEKMAGGDASPRSSAVLKVTWSELVQEIVHLAAFGGCPEHTDLYRTRLLFHRASTIVSGTSEIQRNIIGERVLGLPREGSAKA